MQSVDRSLNDVVDLTRLAEGGFNRTFLITVRGGFQMVARIPYLATIPKYFAVASEVATMAFLRGNKLSNIWLGLGEREIISVLRELAQLESKMMSIAFPASGSLYYAKDLARGGRGAWHPARG